jgi:hypothetical protein
MKNLIEVATVAGLNEDFKIDFETTDYTEREVEYIKDAIADGYIQNYIEVNKYDILDGIKEGLYE